MVGTACGDSLLSELERPRRDLGCWLGQTRWHKVMNRNRARPCEESAEPVVPMKRGNAREGKGLDLG